MKRISPLLALAGLALAIVLFARSDAAAIAGLVVVAGPGLVLASAVHAVPMAINAYAWQLLFAPHARPALARLLHATWLRESVNGLLPVARIGGEVVAYRVVRGAGVAALEAASTLVADMAVSVVTQAAVTFAGLALLVRAGVGGDIALAMAAAGAALALAGLLFARAQHAGVATAITRQVNRVFAGRFEAAIAGSVQLDHALRAIYQRRRSLVACAAWQCAGWVAGAAEIWLALRFLGHDVAVADAVMIELLIQAVSSAAFVVPGALGVQEAAFALVGVAAGLDGTTALALAAARRLRDAVVFFPGLVAWHWTEARGGAAAPERRP